MNSSTGDRYLVVSTDGHAGLLPEKYRDYLDPQYREHFDRVIAAEIAERQAREKDFLIKDYNEKWRSGKENLLHAAWDSDLRTRVIDEDGVAAEVLFPDGITERNAPPSAPASASSRTSTPCSNGRERARTTGGSRSSARSIPCGASASRSSRCSPTSTWR